MKKPTKAAVPLTAFQKEWIKDKSRYKAAAKSRRIGFTFGATLEIALDAADHRTRWLAISRAQDTSKEAIAEVKRHFQAMRMVEEAEAEIREEDSDLFFEGARLKRFVLELPNGSEIVGMTAHPDAARGFGGNVFLDEFGFHRDSHELWKGASAAVMRGHRLIVVSTPHYQTGKYFEIAREAQLTLGHAPAQRQQGIWSAHWVDIHTAAPQLAAIGVPVDLAELRKLAGDEETWQQEYCCSFLSAAELWLSLELIAAARSPQAHLEWNPEREYEGWLYVGVDQGRKKDLTAIWIDEVVAGVAVCQGLITLRNVSFEQQWGVLDPIIGHPRVRRVDMDATGLGMQQAERAQQKYGYKVEPVTFTQERKEALAILARRRFEEKLDKIPENAPEIENHLAAIKRQTTASGNLRFDAARTDAGHADIAWAKFLADAAADSGVAAASPAPPEPPDAPRLPRVERLDSESRPSLMDPKRELRKSWVA